MQFCTVGETDDDQMLTITVTAILPQLAKQRHVLLLVDDTAIPPLISLFAGDMARRWRHEGCEGTCPGPVESARSSRGGCR
jgi:hypothetical protein